MNTQTITVKDVQGPNPNGWYEVELEEGDKVSTKNEEIAKAAFQARGTEAEGIITESVSGKFTNRYLNEFNGVKDTPKGKKRSTSTARPHDPAREQRIARQWAYGRATELLIASGDEFSFPLDSASMSALSEQAEALLNATK